MSEVTFHGRIKRIVTIEPKEEGDEPETILQVRVEAVPERLHRLVGKPGRWLFAPYQMEMPFKADGVQGQLWDVAPARTVPPPEPSEQQESAGPALPITWRIENDRPEAVDANGVLLGLFAEFRAVWGERCDVWVVTLPTGHEQEIGGADMTSEEAQRIAVEMAFPEVDPPLPWRVGEWERMDEIGQAWEVFASQTDDGELQTLMLNWERYYGGFSAVWVATLPDGDRIRVSPENVAVADEQARVHAQAQAILRAWGESAIVGAPDPTDEATIEECEEIVAQAQAEAASEEEADEPADDEHPIDIPAPALGVPTEPEEDADEDPEVAAMRAVFTGPLTATAAREPEREPEPVPELVPTMRTKTRGGR